MIGYTAEEYRETIARAQLSLAAMRTCRAVYAEMSRLLWSCNIFMFAKAQFFKGFVESRTQVQRDWIRHLVLRPLHHIYFASVPSPHWDARNYPGLSKDPGWTEALIRLPNLVSVYLTARYEMTVEDIEAMWCSRELVDKTGKTATLDIIDALAAKSTLVRFYPDVVDITVWCRNPRNPKAYYFHRSGDDKLKNLLRTLLRKMVTGRTDIEGEHEDTDWIDSEVGVSVEAYEDQLQQRRRRSYEEYASKVLRLPWMNEDATISGEAQASF